MFANFLYIHLCLLFKNLVQSFHNYRYKRFSVEKMVKYNKHCDKYIY